MFDEMIIKAGRSLGVDIVRCGRRAAYFAPEVGCAYWVTRKDLEFALRCARLYGADAYSHWCAGTSAARMSKQAVKRYFVADER
jgi:hypothetical protein